MATLTKRMFDTMPPFYGSDPILQGTLDAIGRELQRLDDFYTDMRFRMFPQNADDKYRTLGMWELLLNLPVEPAGVSLAQRRSLVLSRMQSNSVASGAEWVAAMNQALGGTPWTYQEGPAANTVTLAISFGVAAFSSVQVLALARLITPAHIDVAVIYQQGFIVGEGRVGEDRL
jgi:Uncharacterised protein conserved in bacteria (DUF2313)